jgi:hypothetical protein
VSELLAGRPIFDEVPLSGTFVIQEDNEHPDDKAETCGDDARSGNDTPRACFHCFAQAL